MTEGDAADIVDGVDENARFEAWRLMTTPFRMKTTGHNRKRLMRLLEAQYEGNFAKRTMAFEKAVKEYETLSKRNVDEETKLRVLESKLAPGSLKEHLAGTGENPRRSTTPTSR